MKIELSSLKAEVANIGKTIKISKKAYRWEFQAKFIKETVKAGEPEEIVGPELLKYAG
jgi:hypothetical protein